MDLACSQSGCLEVPPALVFTSLPAWCQSQHAGALERAGAQPATWEAAAEMALPGPGPVMASREEGRAKMPGPGLAAGTSICLASPWARLALRFGTARDPS